MTHIIVIIYRTPHFLSPGSILSYATDLPFKFSFFTVKSPALLKDWFLKITFLKKSKNPSPFLCKTIIRQYAQIILLHKLIFFFKIVKFKFKVTIYYSL